jgi:hypothetical protein
MKRRLGSVFCRKARAELTMSGGRFQRGHLRMLPGHQPGEHSQPIGPAALAPRAAIEGQRGWLRQTAHDIAGRQPRLQRLNPGRSGLHLAGDEHHGHVALEVELGENGRPRTRRQHQRRNRLFLVQFGHQLAKSGQFVEDVEES